VQQLAVATECAGNEDRGARADPDHCSALEASVFRNHRVSKLAGKCGADAAGLIVTQLVQDCRNHSHREIDTHVW
jgi:hypothetical protein